MRRALLFFAAIAAGCGSDPPIIYLPADAGVAGADAGIIADSGMVGAEVADFGGRIFEFGEASVFGLAGSFRFEVAAFAGAPKKAAFVIRSNSGSDEAAGELSIDTDCELRVATSSFPANAKVLAGAVIVSACAYDPATAVLRLPDPAAGGVEAVSTACDLPDEGGPCIPGS